MKLIWIQRGHDVIAGFAGPLPEDTIQTQLDRFADGLVRYRDEHLDTGSFLRAVLENDLANAVRRADRVSFLLLPVVLQWLSEEMPPEAWGDRTAVVEWLQRLPEEPTP